MTQASQTPFCSGHGPESFKGGAVKKTLSRPFSARERPTSSSHKELHKARHASSGLQNNVG